jgi:two-component system LytT family response regulator
MTVVIPPSRWRVVIVDDEPPARATLRLLLSAEPDFELIAECAHGEEAVAAITRALPDLVFLDVQMPGMDGFDVLRRVGPASIPALVFVTAYDRYALRAFEIHALEYLLKPFSDERFAEVLARVRGRLRERRFAEAGRRLTALLESSATPGPRQLVVRDGSRTVVIPTDEIIWIEAEDYYARIHATGRRTLVRLSLKSLADDLDAARFVRVHRSAIVNLAFVRQLEPLASGDQRLVLSDGTELRVSRTYRPALDERLGRR